MKALLIILAIVIALALMGWISFTATDSSATVTIDRQEIGEDTEQLSRATRDAFDRVAAATEFETENESETEPEEKDPDSTPRNPTPRNPIVDEDAAAQATP